VAGGQICHILIQIKVKANLQGERAPTFLSEKGRSINMADVENTGAQDADPLSGWQVFIDDPSMLLFLGIASPTLLYTLWGVMEVLSVPIAGY